MVNATLFAMQLDWLHEVGNYLLISTFLENYYLDNQRMIALKAI
jgi:hypothetical protein